LGLPLACEDAGFILDIVAPLPNAPSMTGLLEIIWTEITNKRFYTKAKLNSLAFFLLTMPM
jgi:hypothetical protein